MQKFCRRPHLNTANSLAPNDASVLYSRALVKINLRDKTGALADVRASVKLDPKDLHAVLVNEMLESGQGDLVKPGGIRVSDDSDKRQSNAPTNEKRGNKH